MLLVYNEHAPTVLEGFGFGGALLAMFMRVGGGIFTKAADVGADLVGKVEAGIPEDDPRNAATIADNVGDNVGDCAGMAADLFESYAVTLVAALILGQTAFGAKGLLLPLIIGGIGVDQLRRRHPDHQAARQSDRNGLVPINRGFFISAAVSLVLVAVVAFTYLPEQVQRLRRRDDRRRSGNPKVIAFVAVLIGIVLAVLIQQLTGYFTDTVRRPVKDVGETSLTGPATVILAGIALGLESAVYTAMLIALAVFGAFLLGSGSIAVALFAVALAGCGLLTTAGVIVSMDTFGPVSDNAQGIAEMSGDIDEAGAQRAHRSRRGRQHHQGDHQGHRDRDGRARRDRAVRLVHRRRRHRDRRRQDTSRRAITSHFITNRHPAEQPGRRRSSARRSYSCSAVWPSARSAGRPAAWSSRCASSSATKPGIMDFTEKPDYSRVVDICTKDSLRELATPGLLAIFAPITIGFTFGVGPLAGYLAGAIAAGVLMAVFLANSGGAWDNAKKMVEDGVLRRQGQRGARGHRYRRHRRRPVQGHGRPGDQPADQGDEPGVGAGRARRGPVEPRRQEHRRRCAP